MSTPIEHESKQLKIRCLVPWYSQEGQDVVHGHKPREENIRGKIFMYWILWLKEKACWQVDKVYWKTRRSCREMVFFFLNLITINSTDRVRIIIDSPSNSYSVLCCPLCSKYVNTNEILYVIKVKRSMSFFKEL